MRHLFFTLAPASFGEALTGLRLAAELAAEGDEVLFLGAPELASLARIPGVRYGKLGALSMLPRTLAEVVAEERCASVTLLDAVSVAVMFQMLRLDPSIFARLPVPVLAVDMWNLDEVPAVWDMGPTRRRTLPAWTRALPRLFPVPFVRPEAQNAYAALPTLRPLSTRERAGIRARLGVGENDRLILWATAQWQHASFQPDPTYRAFAAALPPLIFHYLATLGPRVKLVQVGPRPLPGAARLGAGYRHCPSLPADAFNRLVAAADLFLGFNLAASTIASAIAARVPVLVGENAIAGPRDDLAPVVRAWMTRAQPYPFRAWPIGLYAVLAPILAGNPLLDAIEVVPVLDPRRFVFACGELLFDPARAAALRARQDIYARRVAELPRSAERFRAVLASAASGA